jgi:hypothetical protein
MRRTPGVKEVVVQAMPRSYQSVAGGTDPNSVGARDPSGWARRLRVLVPAIAVPLAVACANGSADQVTKPVALAMTSMMTPYYSDGQISLYQVQVPVPLPVRKMTSADNQSVGAAPPGTPYPRGVFLRAEDEAVEVHFTISNLDDTRLSVWLLIDPWNEFVRWRPGVTVVNDEDTQPNYGYDQEFTVEGKGRIEGTITTDDMHEIAIKLASVEKLLASMQAQATGQAASGAGFDATSIANNIFNPQNRSNGVPSDPLYTPWIPPVIAGLTGFDLGLRTSAPANVAVEISMEVQDLRGDRFVLEDSNAAQMGPPPQTLSPPSARF